MVMIVTTRMMPCSARQGMNTMDTAALRRPVYVVRSLQDRGLHHLEVNGGGKLEPEDGEEEIARGRQSGSVWPEGAGMRLQRPWKHRGTL